MTQVFPRGLPQGAPLFRQSRNRKSNLLPGGRWKRIQAPREVKGFRLFDIVALDGTRAYVHGRRATGRFVVKDLDGRTLSNSINCKELRLISRSNRYLFNAKKRDCPIPPPSKDGSILGIFS